ncbi:hypothetical protein CDAR_120541, partial [Caerostris darwini]
MQFILHHPGSTTGRRTTLYLSPGLNLSNAGSMFTHCPRRAWRWLSAKHYYNCLTKEKKARSRCNGSQATAINRNELCAKGKNQAEGKQKNGEERETAKLFWRSLQKSRFQLCGGAHANSTAFILWAVLAFCSAASEPHSEEAKHLRVKKYKYVLPECRCGLYLSNAE